MLLVLIIVFLLFSMPLAPKNVIEKTTSHSGNLDTQF